jgi:hypothetical protein
MLFCCMFYCPSKDGILTLIICHAF